ncbi:MAG: 6-phosphofructokinase [Firmicutes bacterium]|nr:6-phosphofructokinase [Bacillota bacterium]
MKKIGVLTSGGDAPGMNAAIRAVVRQGISLGMEVYGIRRGFEGLLDGDLEEMKFHSVGDVLQRGGTILRTARSKRFLEDEWIDHGARMLNTFGIEGIVVIGGEGSYRGGYELSQKGITVMGVPGTIDNDLGYTDFSIGFDTAVNTILGLISNIRDTSSSHERTTIIEVMGRHCGDLALYAGLSGGADVIMIPEIELDINEVCRKVLKGQRSGKAHSIIIKAEGVSMDTAELARLLEEMTAREARAVVPGYIQRGGSPTEYDRRLASMTGAKAVQLLYDDTPSRAIGVQEGQIISVDLGEAIKMTREFKKDIYDLTEVLA